MLEIEAEVRWQLGARAEAIGVLTRVADVCWETHRDQSPEYCHILHRLSVWHYALGEEGRAAGIEKLERFLDTKLAMGPNHCDLCGLSKTDEVQRKLLKCSKCHVCRFCNQEHQRLAHTRHKQVSVCVPSLPLSARSPPPPLYLALWH